ncbi:hypothetical protein [Tropicibacter naphthalenivorans]|uniref:C4-dicarboxylate ABC transporter substrate-binding protein n=1 Tax=Tropicibacter naphthalenivorans TaxID=441103 RepID=A0A0P1GJ93_9RHOB|nr:hypothetical protein [Tropicibacter naphthalenivorans]CUH82168.1 hypothetical protein TRN7648_03841 [Tropicibacter naphthalenivorans]SMD05030.1 hypothetical protein SAMN04488093_11263 [Tropicibacter naphthalenivorans]
MKNLTSVVALAAALAGVGGVAGAETLVFSTTNAQQHPINTGFLTPWAERITASGAVEIDVRHGRCWPTTRTFTTASAMT